ncbi:MAG: hypothetical protein LUQ26_09955 [Methylococcaceae bacterium]|nr:hypothetical protein [Methylococcaceae bacterium]
MSIEKALNPAPSAQGIAALDPEKEPLEIAVKNPEEVKIKKGKKTILTIKPEIDEDEFSENLAEKVSDAALQSMSSELITGFDEDINSRKEWLESYVKGIELLGINPMEDRSDPWEGACAVVHPLLIEACCKFQAEIMTSSFPAMGPCKTKIIGKQTEELKEASIRVQEDMNYNLTEVMVEFRPEHERAMFGLALCGNAFKKVYFDPSLNRQVSMYIPAEDIVVPYGSTSLETSERITHVMRKTKNEIIKLQYEGFYREIEIGEPTNMIDDVEKKIAERLGFRVTLDERYKLLEMQVNLDLEGYEHKDENGEYTGIELPYIVTIDKGTTTILAIRRNWEPDDKKFIKREHLVHYGYIPAFGFYCLGLINLIGGFAKSGTSLIRQLVDAGTLSNLPGGFKSRGLRIKGDDTPVSPGEWRDVDVASGTLKENFLPLPYKGADQTLFSLLTSIVEEGRKLAGSADLAVSDMSSNSPVGTTLAVLERTLKLISAIQGRVHYSMKRELQLIRNIIRDYTPTTYSYDPQEGTPKAKRSDYKNVAVVPVSDPNAATLAQRVVQYQAVLQLAQTAQQLYDMPLLHRQMLEVLGVPNYQKLVPMDDDLKPRDPVTENQNILKGKPVKAFLYQDHQAHIIVHTAVMHDPKVQQVLQAAFATNPQGLAALQATLGAHIAEHLGYEYRKQIEQAMGRDLPTYGDSPEDEDNQVGIPAEIELQVSKLAAQASQQLLQQNLQEQQNQQNQQKQQDPLIQMQQQELKIKESDLARKSKRDDEDIAVEYAKLGITKNKNDSTAEAAGATVAANLHINQSKLQEQHVTSAAKIGTDIAKTAAQHEHEIGSQAAQHEHDIKVAKTTKPTGGKK